MSAPGDVADSPYRPPVAAPPAAPGSAAPWGPGATALLGILLVGGYLLLQGVLTAVGAGVVMALSGAAGPDDLMRAFDERAGLLFSLATALAAPAAVAATMAVAWAGLRRGGVERPEPALRRSLGLVRPARRRVVAWTLATAAFMAGYELAARLLERPPLPDFLVEMHATAGWLPGLLVAVVVLAPVAEEVLFRGFLLPGLAAGPAGGAGAVVATALLFAVIHLQYDLFDMTGVCGLGLLLGAARWHSGSLWLPVGLHMAVNLLAAAQLVWVLGW
jgi:membrane protease YdiL (CAAX protease family)